jgi:gliding motility-associated-like protein
MKQFFYLFIFLCWSTNYFSQSSGGTLSSNTIVCQNFNSGLLSLNTYSGTIQRWESSLGPSGPWTPLVITSNSYNYSNLTQTTYFRVVVQLTGYPIAYSNVVIVSCDAPVIAGTVSSTSFQCVNFPASATITGNTGSVISWEASTNNWITTHTLTTTNTLIATIPTLSLSTLVRARIQNGVCPAICSNTVTIVPASISDGGSISGTQSVCAISNAATLSLNNYTGSILQWESSTSSGGPFYAIASSANTSTMAYSSLQQTMWYRALVKSGTCSSTTSPVFSVHVDAISVGGNIIGTQSVCAMINTGTLQLIANTGSINQWEYSFNNGSSWNILNTISSIQTFSNITLSRIYRAGIQNGLCPAVYSSQFTVNVNALPTVTFNLSDACMNTGTPFTNLTVGSNFYVWSFGDGGSANIINPNHAYFSSGTFTVKLSATSSLGCTDSLKKTITIHPTPSAIISSSDAACYGSSLNFNNASSISTGNISNLRFNFNDGSPTTTLIPAQHLFMSEGTYSVFLTATSNFGCVDSALKRITIYPKPTSNFAATNVCKGSSMLFNNLSNISTGGLSHSWDFGNGNFSNLASPNYNYPNAGTYMVSLISKSIYNCSDTTYKSMTVNEKPNITFSVSNVCLGLPAIFTSTFTPSNLSTSATINFGDGSNSGNANTIHHYVSSGTFASSVIAVTDSGCVSSTSRNVTIYSKPFTNFNFNNVCNANSVTFNNTSSIGNGTIHYLWDLNGLITTTVNSPAHLFTEPGTYTISLIATSNFDCVDTIIKPITIFDAPKADFNFSNSCNGFPVTFTNSSTVTSGVISHTNWDFGDNSTANVINPQKDYLNNGTYTVTLITISSNGCSDTAKKEVNVYEGPVAKFNARSQCLKSAISFTNLSTLSIGSYVSTWRFGDQKYSLQNSPDYEYANSGSYQVWLKVMSSNFCVDSISHYVEVYRLPKLEAGKDTTLDKGQGIQLNAGGAKIFNWLPTTGLSNPTIHNPYASPDSSTRYIVTGYDENGCKSSDTITVKINDSFLVIPYNVLTPDGNGLNDTWIVKNIEAYKENHVIIFDQWNQKILEEDSYANTWDGKNKAGELLPDATYYYILTFKNSPKKYTGYITLIRNK